MTLEEILQNHFYCNKPFLKSRVIEGHFTGGGGEPDPHYRYLTRTGEKAYGTLVCLLYDLGELIGNQDTMDAMVTTLDSIVSEP